MEEVYITGLGVRTPIGSGVEQFWKALVAGTSGVGPVTRFDTSWLPTHIAAEIKDFYPQQDLTEEKTSTLEMAAELAISAGQEALANAGLLNDEGQGTRPEMDLFVGTTRGELFKYEAQSWQGWINNNEEIQKVQLKNVLLDNVTYGLLPKIARKLNLLGLQSIVTNACAAGGYAITLGAERVRQGKTHLALCGAVDVLSVSDYAGFCSLRALAPERCQPFDINRRGLVMGEAGAMLVLESGESLQRRQGRALAKLAGYGWSCDGYHISAPHPQGRGVMLALQRALLDAGKQPASIDCIIAHGTGTPGNDRVEAQAIRKVFGEAAPPVTAPKSMLGHSIGAASAVEAVIAVLSIQKSVIPPTINHEQIDPECPIDCVANQPRYKTIKACLANSSGFGGNNASLIFIHPEEEGR